MILSSHQPNFMPYMGFFYKAFKSDIMAMSIDVTFSKQGRHNWNLIRSVNGPRKLMLPVHAHHDTRLADVRFVDLRYNLEKAIKGLIQDYRKAPFYGAGMELTEAMEDAAASCGDSMAKFNVNLIQYICKQFGIDTTIISTMPLDLTGQKDDRILQMCEKVGADVYLSGEGARVYHIPEKFENKGIELLYSHYEAIRYPQVHGEFVENLSVVDYIFNQGFALPKEWVR